MPGLRHYQTRGLIEHLLLVGSMSALDAKLVSQLTTLLEGTIGIALYHSQQDSHDAISSHLTPLSPPEDC
jgi:hypothetical protein